MASHCGSRSPWVLDSWVATTGGHNSNVVCDVMLAAAGNCCGSVSQAPTEIEWLTANDSGYTAANTKAFVSTIRLKSLITTTFNLQSNSMVKRFMKTMKRDYIIFMPKLNSATALRQAFNVEKRPIYLYAINRQEGVIC